jgi:xylulokinase
MRLFADVWGIPVRRRDLVDEATALGAAIVGGVAVGMFPDYSVGSALSASSAPYEPDAARHAEYAVAHERFVDAYRRLEPWFDAAP